MSEGPAGNEDVSGRCPKPPEVWREGRCTASRQQSDTSSLGLGWGHGCQLRSTRRNSYLKAFASLFSVTLLLCSGMDFFASHRNKKVCVNRRSLLLDICII